MFQTLHKSFPFRLMNKWFGFNQTSKTHCNTLVVHIASVMGEQVSFIFFIVLVFLHIMNLYYLWT